MPLTYVALLTGIGGVVVARRWLRARHATKSSGDEQRQRDGTALKRALEEFQRTRGITAMGAHVLRSSPELVIVRVMHLTNHVPPDRVWFAVTDGGAAVRELSFDDVATMETTPWR